MGCGSAPWSNSSPSEDSSSGSYSGSSIWVPLLKTGHDERDPRHRRRVPRHDDRVRPRLDRPRSRHLEQCHRAPAPSGSCRRRPRRGRGRRGGPALRLAGGRGDLVAQQPLHVARRRGGPFRHPPLHRPGPTPGPVDLQRPPDVLEQPGVPPGVLRRSPRRRRPRSRRRPTPRRSAWPIRPCSRRSRSSARPAATSRRGRDSWSGPGWWRPTPTSSRGRATATPRCVLDNNAYNATTVFFDPAFDLAVLRTDAPLGPALTITPISSRGERRRRCSATPRTRD